MKNFAQRFALVLFLFGAGVFLGSVFAVVAVARANDFTAEWARVFAARANMLTIVDWVTLPGLVSLTLGALALTWFRSSPKLRSSAVVISLLVGMLVLNTTLVVVPTARRLMHMAEKLSLGGSSATGFLSLHTREDVYGALNLLLYLAVVTVTLMNQRSGQKVQPGLHQ